MWLLHVNLQHTKLTAYLFLAPNVYNVPESERRLHDNAPKYTFGLKTPIEKPSDTPG